MSENMKESNERVKMATPDYVLDIRKGLYSFSGGIAKILKESNIKSFPINVWDIARKLNFEVLEATFKNEHTSGMMIDALEVPNVLKPFNCKRAIILNKQEKKSMQSFTIAHELGHFIFHCNENENCFDAYHISREKDEINYTNAEIVQKEKEDEMDKFAAALLMPESMFMDFISKSPNRHDKVKLTKEMAKVCMVEEIAVEKRFAELGIEFYS